MGGRGTCAPLHVSRARSHPSACPPSLTKPWCRVGMPPPPLPQRLQLHYPACVCVRVGQSAARIGTTTTPMLCCCCCCHKTAMPLASAQKCTTATGRRHHRTSPVDAGALPLCLHPGLAATCGHVCRAAVACPASPSRCRWAPRPLATHDMPPQVFNADQPRWARAPPRPLCILLHVAVDVVEAGHPDGHAKHDPERHQCRDVLRIHEQSRRKGGADT